MILTGWRIASSNAFDRVAERGRAVVMTLVVVIVFASSMGSPYAHERLPIVLSLPLGLSPFPTGQAIDPTLARFGEFLFYTPVLSRDHSIACVSCHDPAYSLSGPTPLAVGINNAVGRRHAPPLINLYTATSFMLDGRATTLPIQVRFPLESHAEMDIDWPIALLRLSEQAEVRQFVAASPDSPFGKELVQNALASYVRSLVSGGSAFDRYYFEKDESALNEDEKEGFALFVRKGRCASCHLVNGFSAMLTDNGFHSIGSAYAAGSYKDLGRFDVTGQDTDRGAFKTPTLRNVAQRKYYMHDGSMSSMKDVIEFYDRGGNRDDPNIDPRIQRLFLTESEIQKIISFLGSLNSPISSYR